MDAHSGRPVGPSEGCGGGVAVPSAPHATADPSLVDRLRALAEGLRLVAEQAAALAAEIAPPAPQLTVAAALHRFEAWARGYYRKGGRETPEVGCLKRPLSIARELYGGLPAADFGLQHLRQVRERLVATLKRPVRVEQEETEDEVPRLARKTVNDHVARVVRAFRWCAAEELIPAAVPQRLALLGGLRRGRSAARETDRVLPVEWDQVEPVLEHLRRQTRALVELLWWTGARVNEICSLRPCDLDRTGAAWLYRVRDEANKLAHLEQDRVVAIGPKAQAVLAPFLDRIPQPPAGAFLFSPADAVAELNAERRTARTLPPWPSHDPERRRERRGTKLELLDRYTPGALRRAVERACAAAGVEVWTPGQLRHSCATRLRRELGDLQGVACVLGHRDPGTTLIYAEADLRRAMEIAGRLG